MKKYIGNNAILKLIELTISELNNLRSKITNIPISNSSSITEAGKFALDAVEKNSSISGTLANKLTAKADISSIKFKKGDVYTSGWSFFYGFSLVGKKGLYFVVPLPKMLTMSPADVEFIELVIYGSKSIYNINIGTKPTSMTFSYKNNFLYVVMNFDSLPDLFIDGSHDKPLTGQAQFKMTV